MLDLYRTGEFDENYDNLDHSDQIKVDKVLIKLREQGDHVGKELHYSFLKEKRIGGKRLYFLLYLDLHAILMLFITNKKMQQCTIDRVLSELPNYERFVREQLQENTTS